MPNPKLLYHHGDFDRFDMEIGENSVYWRVVLMIDRLDYIPHIYASNLRQLIYTRLTGLLLINDDMPLLCLSSRCREQQVFRLMYTLARK